MKAFPASQAPPEAREKVLFHPDPCIPWLFTPAPRQRNSRGQRFKQSGEGSLKYTALGQVTARPSHTRTRSPVVATYLLEFLGFDLHLLLQGRVGAPELHGLLVPEHHLLLHFPLTAFLGRGRGQGSEEQHILGRPKGALPVMEPGSVVATGARRAQRVSHSPRPSLPPHP